MFNNLIESSSHTKEYRRRGSFLLFTGATYLVLFVIAGVASIYAYDAHLEQQTTELEVLSWVPQPPVEPVVDVVRSAPRPTSTPTANTPRPTRIELIDSTSNPLNPPPGCPFQTRCHRKIGAICETELPPVKELAPGHKIELVEE